MKHGQRMSCHDWSLYTLQAIRSGLAASHRGHVQLPVSGLSILQCQRSISDTENMHGEVLDPKAL